MKKILCISAPPGAGKDTVAQILRMIDSTIQHIKYARILKERTHALYGLAAPWDAYEGAIKDQPLGAFMGISPRQAYINVSELLMKPVHGKTVWSDMLINQIDFLPYKKFVISDVGFQTEWDELAKRDDFKIAMLRIHRNGFTYENDSRGTVDPGGYPCINIFNDGSMEELAEAVGAVYRAFYDR